MNTVRISIVLLCAALATVFISSCSDNPVDKPSEAHVEAFGLVIYNSGAEIVRYQNGTVTGEIEAIEGEDTALLTVRFLDESGNVISSDKLAGNEHTLHWEIKNTAIADVEQHNDDGKWNFHIEGKEVGQTTVKIILFHNDHADFTSKEIPIHVEAGVQITEMKLLLNGAERVTATTDIATGALALPVGSARYLEVQFTDENGEAAALGDGHEIALEFVDPSLVSATAGTTSNAFNITASKAGSTQLRVRLIHNDEHGHEPRTLYISPAIAVSAE